MKQRRPAPAAPAPKPMRSYEDSRVRLVFEAADDPQDWVAFEKHAGGVYVDKFGEPAMTTANIARLVEWLTESPHAT